MWATPSTEATCAAPVFICSVTSLPNTRPVPADFPFTGRSTWMFACAGHYCCSR